MAYRTIAGQKESMMTKTRTQPPRRRRAASAGAGEPRRRLKSTKRDRRQHDDGEVRQQQLGAGIRDRMEGLLTAWHATQERLRAHLWLIEAESMLSSAQRLARDQYYVAAETELTSALRLVQEAAALLPAEDARLGGLVQKIQRATRGIREEGRSAAARLEQVVEINEHLLGALAQ